MRWPLHHPASRFVALGRIHVAVHEGIDLTTQCAQRVVAHAERGAQEERGAHVLQQRHCRRAHESDGLPTGTHEGDGGVFVTRERGNARQVQGPLAVRRWRDREDRLRDGGSAREIPELQVQAHVGRPEPRALHRICREHLGAINRAERGIPAVGGTRDLVAHLQHARE